jgi:hypothetical protein
MAEDKKGFILYADQKELFSQLPDELAGKLIKHIMAYVNDEDPVSEDIVINIAFTPIKLQLKRDLIKFEETKGRRSIAGKIGAEKRWQTMANDGNRIQAMANDSKPKQTIAKIAVNDNVNVKEKDIYIYSFLNSLIDYGFDKDLSKEWMKVRKDKGATNTLTAFKGFVKEVEKNGNEINFILRTCIERSWKGFNSEWIPKVLTEQNREPSKWKAPWS